MQQRTITLEEFEALSKRVADLEQMVSEIPKALQGMMGVAKVTTELIDKLPLLMEHVSALANAVGTIQEELHPSDSASQST